jgi:hypothetical protein
LRWRGDAPLEALGADDSHTFCLTGAHDNLHCPSKSRARCAKR